MVASEAPVTSGFASPMTQMSSEICLAALPGFFGSAQPIGRIATTSRSLAADMKDAAGQLRVGAIVTGRLSSAMEGLNRASLQELEVFRLDLSRESREVLSKPEIEKAIRQVALRLSKASALQVLAVRLPAFDASMDRLRLGLNAWEALIRCLGELSRHGRLHSLELSSITIKNSRATQECNMSTFIDSCDDETVSLLDAPPSGSKKPRTLRRAVTEPTTGNGVDATAATDAAAAAWPKLSFLDALARLSTLEQLVLTHDEIFGNTAQLLPPVFRKMASLKRVDLTRNHISKEVMKELRADMPKNVELCGDELQTFYFY